MIVAHRVRGLPIELADGDRRPVSEEDAAGLQPIRAEIDEAADGPLGADFLGDDDLVQPVLRETERCRPRRDAASGHAPRHGYDGP